MSISQRRDSITSIRSKAELIPLETMGSEEENEPSAEEPKIRPVNEPTRRRFVLTPRPPPKKKLTRLQRYRQVVWNADTKEFFGRTVDRWFKIIAFYICFYFFLAAFWFGLLAIFYSTLDFQVPAYQLRDSPLGDNPGLGFRPSPPKLDFNLIQFRYGNNKATNGSYWSNNLEQFLEPYLKNRDQHGEECLENNSPGNGKFCRFDVTKLLESSGCNQKTQFGYRKGEPCVLIKINRIYNWIPKAYNVTELQNPEIPQQVKDGYRQPGGDQMIYITCSGLDPIDKESIGDFLYTPAGIPFHYFPFTNQPGYLSPFVLVQIHRPASSLLLNIECRAWAANIHYHRKHREGSIQFAVVLDNF